MYCPKCNSQNPDDAAFCAVCGSSLRMKAPGQAKDLSRASSAYETQAASADQMSAQNPESFSNRENYQNQENYRNNNGYQQNQGSYQNNNSYQQNQGSYQNNNGYQQNQRSYQNNNGYQQDRGNYRNNNSYQQNQGSYQNNNSYQQNQGSYQNNNSYQPNSGYESVNGSNSYGNSYGNSGSRRQAKGLPNGLIPSICEGVALLFGIVIVFAIARGNFTPEHVAEQYFVSLVNGDYEQAYNLVDPEEDDFIKEEAFENYWKDVDFSEVENYEVEEQDDFDDDDDDSDDIGKTILISYRNEGDSTDSWFSVSLTKAKEKKYLFFDDWKVSYDTMVANDVTVEAAPGISVSVDGIDLDESYSITVEGDTSGDIFYRVPRIFIGTHTICASGEGRADGSDVWEIYGDNENYYVSELAYDEATIQTLEQKAIENMQVIYSTAAKGGVFSEIADRCSSDPENLESLQSDYEKLAKFFTENDIVEIRFTKVDTAGGTMDTTIRVTYEYQLDYNYADTGSNAYLLKTSSGSDSYDVTFVQENGNWVQKNLGCKALSF